MEPGHEGPASCPLHDDSLRVHRDVHDGRRDAQGNERGGERRQIAGDGGDDQRHGEHRQAGLHDAPGAQARRERTAQPAPDERAGRHPEEGQSQLCVAQPERMLDGRNA